MTDQIPFITGSDIRRSLPIAAAIDALEASIQNGLDPAQMPHRRSIPVEAGEFLVFPAEYSGYISTKVLGLAPANPAAGLPKVQGCCILWDSTTLTPLAILEGSALTAVRTSALSALGVRHLAPASASTLLVFGTGPQARNHVDAIAAVRDIESVIAVGRSPESSGKFAGSLRLAGYRAAPGTPANVSDVGIIACCTTSSDPLFSGSLVRDDAVVVAMGAHDADSRETDDALVSRSAIWVEDIEGALSGAGDIVQPVKDGIIDRDNLRDLRSLVIEGRPSQSGPALFKTVGMGWQDVVTARVVYEAVLGH